MFRAELGDKIDFSFFLVFGSKTAAAVTMGALENMKKGAFGVKLIDNQYCGYCTIRRTIKTTFCVLITFTISGRSTRTTHTTTIKQADINPLF